MYYCPPNVTFLNPWLKHGLSHCFMDTVSACFVSAFMLLFGSIQIRMYMKYSSDLDPRVFPSSLLYKIQIICHFILPLVALIRLILQAKVFYVEFVYGYMILSACLYFMTFPLAFYLLYLERHKVLPSIPTRGHGLVLLVFWTVLFVIENLTFLNLQNEKWWFHLKSLSDRIEFGLFIIRYVCCFSIFVLGLKAPGIPKVEDLIHYRLHTQEESPGLLESGTQSSDRNQSERNRSAFADFGKKCKRLIPFLWPKKSLVLQLRVLVCFFILILGRVINVFVPQYNKYIVDSLSLESKTITFRWDYILTYAMFWFLQGQGNSNFLRHVRTFLWIRIEQYTVKEVEMDVFEHLHSLSLKWHLNRKIGEVLRIVDRGTASISDLLKYVIFNIIPTFADIFIAVLYFALVFNIWFGLIVLVTMALYLIISICLTEWRTKFKRDTNKLDNEVEAKCVDSLLNFETVKYYNAEKFELENYKAALENFQIAEWKDAASLNLLFEAMNITITIGVLAGTLLCAHYVVDGKLTTGDYVLFSTYIVQLYTPLNLFGLYYRLVQIAFVDMENMFTLLGTEPEIVDKTDATSLKVREGSIEFRNVNFSYLPERQILKDISFRIPPGHTAALVGSTGSGKSTIARLLFRLHDIQSGEILIDGQNVTEMLASRYAMQVVTYQAVYVSQSGTVWHIFPEKFLKSVDWKYDSRYNIGYGRPEASFEEIQEAAKAAGIHEQILGFPDGYETVVGERGLKLSGGEKQRIAIARTILKSPSFIIFDEATSSLDTQTEKIIQNSLSVVCANKTTLIIAHRLSTIVHADEILVLKEGEIVERGRHEQLLKKNGMYASMWLQQQEPERKENK